MTFTCPICGVSQKDYSRTMWFHESEHCYSEFGHLHGWIDFTSFRFVPAVRGGAEGLIFWSPVCTQTPRWERVLFGTLQNPFKMNPMWSGIFLLDPEDYYTDPESLKKFQDWHYTANSCGYPVSFIGFSCVGPTYSFTTPVFAHVITDSVESIQYLSKLGVRKTLCNPTGQSPYIVRKANEDQFGFEGFPFTVSPGDYSPAWGSHQIVKLLLNLCKAEKWYQGINFEYSSFKVFLLTEWRFFSFYNMKEPHRNVDFEKKCVYSFSSFNRSQVFN